MLQKLETCQTCTGRMKHSAGTLALCSECNSSKPKCLKMYLLAKNLCSAPSSSISITSILTKVISFPYCVVPENIHTPSTEGTFHKEPSPPPLWKFQILSFVHFLKVFCLTDPQPHPHPPRKFQSPLWGGGGVGILELHNGRYCSFFKSHSLFFLLT